MPYRDLLPCRGPLGRFARGFSDELARAGYTRGSAGIQLCWMGRLSDWMAGEQLRAGELDEAVVTRFLQAQDRSRRRRLPTVLAFGPLLAWLRSMQEIRPAAVPPPGPHDELPGRYESWLADDRGLAQRTAARYLVTARRLLDQSGGTAGHLLTGSQVTSFLLAEAGRGLAPGSLKGRVAGFRALLRFLHFAGEVPAALAGMVPAAAGWRDSRIPSPAPSANDIAALLASCDQATKTGLRDFAILSALARLGLRAAEIAAMETGDIDWRAGEVIIRGKGRRQDRMPLPSDVGSALAAWLCGGRPAVAGCRTVFVTRHAPVRPMHPNTIARVVMFACKRAGLPVMRSHRLRHALATRLLADGTPLPEISQVLRHRDTATTAIYAKVGMAHLRQVAAPWTGAGQ